MEILAANLVSGTAFKCFQVTELSSVDPARGVMSDVSIIQAGEAKGHGILVTQKSLRGAVNLLQGTRLPAYVTHTNAMGDRLTEEIGFFEGFYLDGDRIRAREFHALETFKKYKPEQFDKLFEMAQKLPENFGISLVFEARLFWELPDGEEEDFQGMSARPEDALHDIPSVEMVSIQSADFVDNPAANSSLFSTATKNKPMKTELTTAASDAFEKAQEAERLNEEASKPVEVAEEEAPKRKARKKKLEEVAEVETSVELDEEISQRDEQIESLVSEVQELKSEIETLRGLMQGAEEVEEDFSEETQPERTNAELKAEAVSLMLDANPEMSRSTALLEVGKNHPEYFNQ